MAEPRERDEIERDLPQSDDEARGFETDTDLEDTDELEEGEEETEDLEEE